MDRSGADNPRAKETHRPLLAWGLFGLAVVLLLWLLRAVLLPFALGLAIAYLLNPIIRFLARRGIPRAPAVGILIVLIVTVVAAGIALVVPAVQDEVTALIKAVPRYIEQLRNVMEELRFRASVQGEARESAVLQALEALREQAADVWPSVVKGILSRGANFLSTLSFLLLTPFVAFYLTVDWDRMMLGIQSLMPPRTRPTLVGTAQDIDAALKGFLRGIVVVSAFLAIFYSVGLSLVGLPFAILIAFVAGALTFIPYIGMLTGLFLAMGVAIGEFWPDETWRIAIVFGIFTVGQILEGNFLTPMLMEREVGLHPVVVILALLAFGTLFGFLGILLAVPIAAALSVILKRAVTAYRHSSFYLAETGSDVPHSDEDPKT